MIHLEECYNNNSNNNNKLSVHYGRAYLCRELFRIYDNLKLSYPIYLKQSDNFAILCSIWYDNNLSVCCSTHISYHALVRCRRLMNKNIEVINTCPPNALKVVFETNNYINHNDIKNLLINKFICNNSIVSYNNIKFKVVSFQPFHKNGIIKIVSSTIVEINIIDNEVPLPIIIPKQLCKYPRGYKGILVYGPSGVGKSYLIKGLAKQWNCNLLLIQGASLNQNFAGEIEKQLRNIFNKAYDINEKCIILIDDIDVLCPKRLNEIGHVSSSQVVAQLLTLMDGLNSHSNNNKLLIFGIAKDINTIDNALRRPGRFDKEIRISVPNIDERLIILNNLVIPYNKLLDNSCNLYEIAELCIGFVIADLMSLCRQILYYSHKFEKITQTILKQCVKDIGASSLRSEYIEMSKLSWNDIGGYSKVKKQLRDILEYPLLRKEQCNRLGLKQPSGILLYGPPGCSKTSLVKIAVQSLNLALIVINSASLLSSYVGVTETKLRNCFQRARISRPCVILIDEIDALVVKRNENSSSFENRLVTTLLDEMDGIQNSHSVTVIATTNRLTIIDDALLRPGRFDYIINVPLPTLQDRYDIFSVLTKHMCLNKDVDFNILADIMKDKSGADIKNVCNEAGMIALRTKLNPHTSQNSYNTVINMNDIYNNSNNVTNIKYNVNNIDRIELCQHHFVEAIDALIN